MQRPALTGIHHVTAICGDPQRNLEFYEELLGLRLVKQTVNFDAPTTHHLYYGNERGDPGTVLTFFAWPGLPAGRRGPGQVTTVSFSVPAASLGWWTERLAAHDVPFRGPATRFGERTLLVDDPHGLLLELVGHPGHDPREPWAGGTVPADHAIRGFHAALLSVESRDASAKLLTDVLGFSLEEEGDGRRSLYTLGGGGPGRQLELLDAPGAPPGRVAVGTVHHLAFRVPDEDAQLAWRERLLEHGVEVSPVRDRLYFHSTYFREPGGVLYEIATDGPGFAVDESVDQLGSRLRLPTWLEPRRRKLEAALPPFRRPHRTRVV